MSKEYDRIIAYTSDLLTSTFNIPKSSLEEKDWDEPLTGNNFHLTGMDLSYLLVEIEKHFRIRIGVDALQHYGFSTFRKVCQATHQSLKENEADGFRGSERLL